MADPVFESLKKDKEKKSSLEHEISFKLSASELEILTKKAESLSMNAEELIRVYVLKTPAFDSSVFDKPKGKKKSNSNENTGGVE